MSTCNRFTLEKIGSRLNMPKKSPRTLDVVGGVCLGPTTFLHNIIQIHNNVMWE